jgi:RNA polymerase sigma-70 factor (ECF subfamily)
VTANASDVIVGQLEQAFEEIFRAHYRMTYRTAYGVLGSAEDAEDVAQTVFLRLLHREFPSELVKSPKAYLYRAAVNESLNLVRSRKRSLSSDETDRFEAANSEAADSAEELHARLYEAVAQLNPSAAEMLVLRYVHKYSLKDIAKVLGTSRSTIAVSLFRARARLKKLMRASSAGDER